MTKPTTCSYELSKKLYDMGIRIDTDLVFNEHKARLPKTIWELAEDKNLPMVPAPMLHEILDVMPSEIVIYNRSFILITGKEGNKEIEYYCCYEGGQEDGDRGTASDPNPANAVAKTLIWLVQQEYISVEEINNGTI